MCLAFHHICIWECVGNYVARLWINKREEELEGCYGSLVLCSKLHERHPAKWTMISFHSAAPASEWLTCMNSRALSLKHHSPTACNICGFLDTQTLTHFLSSRVTSLNRITDDSTLSRCLNENFFLLNIQEYRLSIQIYLILKVGDILKLHNNLCNNYD